MIYSQLGYRDRGMNRAKICFQLGYGDRGMNRAIRLDEQTISIMFDHSCNTLCSVRHVNYYRTTGQEEATKFKSQITTEAPS